MKHRLASRKLWVAVGTAAFLALTDQLGIDHDIALYIAGVAATYIAGQSVVDVTSAK